VTTYYSDRGSPKSKFSKLFQFSDWPFFPLTMSLADFLVANAPFTLPRHLYSFVEGQSPLSTTPVVFASLAGYLALIFGIQAAMKNSPPQRLNTLFQAHNVILSGGSLLLLVLLVEEIVPIIWKTGLFNAMCADASWTPVRPLYPSLVCILTRISENGILLHDQLLFQISRAFRHRLPRVQEKTSPCDPSRFPDCQLIGP
jgi:hypothetical protein